MSWCTPWNPMSVVEHRYHLVGNAVFWFLNGAYKVSSLKVNMINCQYQFTFIYVSCLNCFLSETFLKNQNLDTLQFLFMLEPLVWGIIAYTYWCACVSVFVITSASRWQCNLISGGNWEWKRMTSRWLEGDTMVLKCMIIYGISAVTLKGKPWRYNENVFELTRLWCGLLIDIGTFQ